MTSSLLLLPCLAFAAPDSPGVAPTPVSDDADDADEDFDDVVVVTATRTPTPRGTAPVAVEVVTREEIEASGAERLDELLEEQPGLQIESTVVGTAIRMQGMNPEHTLILVDGQRVLGRKDGVVDLSRFAVDDIERVEIVKGPSSVMFGSDAMGGVVHIVTRSPEQKPEVGAHVRVGTFGRVDATADLRVGSKTVKHKANAGYHRSNAWDLTPETLGTTASAYDQLDATYGIQLQPSDDLQVDADISWMQRRARGIDSPPSGAVLDTRQFVDDHRASIRSWWTPGPDTKISARVSAGWFRAQFLADQRNAKASDSYSDDREQLTEATLQLDQSLGDHFLTLGVDTLAQGITSDRLASDGGGDGKADRQRIAVFAQDLWRLGEPSDGPTFTLAPGVRVSADTQFGTAFVPRLATVLTVDPVTIRLSGGTGFRAPDFRELYLLFENPGVGYVVQGDPELKPERSLNATASIDVAPSELGSVSLQVYANRIRDLIATGPSTPGELETFTYENIANATTQGFDLQGRLHPGPLHLEAGYAFVHARDVDLDRPLQGRVPHRVTGSVAIDLPADLLVRAQGGWSSEQPLYLDGSEAGSMDAIPAQFTLDARAAWDLGWAEPFLGVDNITNTGDTRFAPRIPRFYYAGIRVRNVRNRTPAGSNE